MLDTTEKMKTRLKYVELITRVEHVFAKIALNQFIVRDPFTNIAEKIYVHGSQFLEFITEHQGKEQGLAKNAVDTAVLSLGIAQALGLADFTMGTLLLGSLLHDVGMFCIPHSILTAKDLARPEQRCILAHPIHGYNVILKELRYPHEIGLIALQHHEHWDGTGYPQGLSETAITLESRIIAIGDAFTAMITPRSYRPSMTGHQAMNQLADTTQFDPEILQVFAAFMGIYPRGSLVRLNNGALARVMDQTDIPLKPRIRILTYPSGEPCTGEEDLDLREEPRLYITGEAEEKNMVQDGALYETRA
jgi:HD-GYP domain-containing protein (c-di-GMP phosphodiesterase class II)